eukprot:6282338-Prymnesium_polylepis.2
MRPEELNATSDEVLFARIEAVVVVRSTVGAEQPRNLRLAPYITLKLLYRVHERVISLRNSNACPLAKQKVLAWTVLDLTGVDAPPD